MWNVYSKGRIFLAAEARSVRSASRHRKGNAWLFMLASFLGSIWLPLVGVEAALASPIYINSIADLQNIQNDLSGDYVLASNIDASGYKFSPIGESSGAFGSDTYSDPFNFPSSSSGAFTGTLNGQGHTIYGLTINSTAPVVGLFDRIGSAANISNINLQDVSISETSTTKAQFIGSLAGISDGAISNVNVSGTETISATPTSDGSFIPGAVVSGGLVGSTTPSGAISDSSSSVNISASGSAVNLPESPELEMIGGLVGNNRGVVTGSSASGAVNIESVMTYGGAIGGGLIGMNDYPGGNKSALITNSSSTGSVSIINGIGGGFVGQNYGLVQRSYETGSVLVDAGVTGGLGVAGGFAGENSGEISQSYAHGDAVATSSMGAYSQAGGFVGSEDSVDHPSLDEIYATGNVQSIDYPGGLVGGSDPICIPTNCQVTNSYWDAQTTGQNTSLYGGVGLTTAELQSGTLPPGFDSAIWNASPGQYPTLKAQMLADVSPPTVLTLANLSLNAYGTPADLSGYNLVDSTNLSSGVGLSNGFRAIAYQDGNQIVIAIRGTNTGSRSGFKDAFADASWVTGVPSEAMMLYVSQASQFLSEVHADYPDANITLTGHSLGGAIAELLASASGYSATTFDAPGPADLLSLLTTQLSPATALSGGLSPTITNYRLWGDQVSLFGNQLGSVQTVGLLNGPGLTMVTFSQAFADHDLQTLITDLENDTPIGPGDEGPTLTRSQLIFASAVATGLYLFTAQIEPGVDFGFDPIGASSYTFLEDPGSPFLETLMLPQIDGVAGYNVSEFDGEDWYLASFVDPNTLFDFDPEIIGFRFDALDDFGTITDIDGPILFDLTFRDEGTLIAELQVPVTSAAPEPSSLILVFLPLSILAFHAERSRRRREREYVQY